MPSRTLYLGSRVEEAKALEGNPKLRLSISKVNRLGDGSIGIEGTVRVPRGNLDRYKTPAKRQQCAALQWGIKELQSDKRYRVERIKRESEHLYRPIPHESEKSRLERERRKDLAQHEIKDTRRTNEKEIARKKRELAQLSAEINKRVKSRKETRETVSVVVHPTPELLEDVSIEAPVKSRKPELIATVRGFESDHEPEGVGSALRIAGVSMLAIAVEEKVWAGQT